MWIFSLWNKFTDELKPGQKWIENQELKRKQFQNSNLSGWNRLFDWMHQQNWNIETINNENSVSSTFNRLKHLIFHHFNFEWIWLSFVNRRFQRANFYSFSSSASLFWVYCVQRTFVHRMCCSQSNRVNFQHFQLWWLRAHFQIDFLLSI